MTRDEIEAMCEENEIELLLLDGLDSAFVGWVAPECWGGCARAAYSKKLCVDALVSDGMSYGDAVEFLEFNTFGAYLGPQTPIFIN